MLRNMMQYTVDFFLFGYYNLDTSENKNPYGIQDLSGFTAGSDAYKAWKEHNDNIQATNPTVSYHRVEGLDSTLDCDSCTSSDDQQDILTLAKTVWVNEKA